MSVSDDVSTRLGDGLRANEAVWECLHRFPALNLPAWHLGASCVAQTMWNLAHGKAPSADILDYDLVYYDRDLSKEREYRVTRDARELVADLILSLMSRTRRAFILGTRRSARYERGRPNLRG
jgi:uncharacterized protein